MRTESRNDRCTMTLGIKFKGYRPSDPNKLIPLIADLFLQKKFLGESNTQFVNLDFTIFITKSFSLGISRQYVRSFCNLRLMYFVNILFARLRGLSIGITLENAFEYAKSKSATGGQPIIVNFSCKMFMLVIV